MYISVIPTSKSLSKHPYTYYAPEIWQDQIVRGGVVEIPLGKHVITGIIAERDIMIERSLSIEDIRPIHSVLSSTPLLTPGMISGVEMIADRYFLPIHKSLALSLPSPLMTRLEKRSYVLGDFPETGSEKSLYSEFTQEIHHFLSRTFAPIDLEEYLIPGTVLIFPEDMMLTVFLETYKSREDILILKNKSTATRKSQAWIDIYEGKYEIIAGTRRILYYNLHAYTRIIYIEDAFGHEHYQYPITIKSLDILEVWREGKEQSITIITSTPTLELLARFQQVKIRSIKKIHLIRS